MGAALAGAYLVGPGAHGRDVVAADPFVWLVIALAIPIAALRLDGGGPVHVMSFRMLDDLRRELFDRFRELAPAYFLQRRSGDVARRVHGDVELIELSTRRTSLPPFIVAFVVPVLALIGLFLMHWALALVVLPFVLLGRRASRRGCCGARRRRARRCGDELGELGANVVDVVQGRARWLTTGSGPRFLELIGKQHERLARAASPTAGVPASSMARPTP